MSKFLTGDELENKLTDIIWNAKRYIIIVSPFIKLDKHITEVLEKVESTHEISIYIVFGKNEEYKHKSFNEKDLEFFKSFKNITILYNKNLHAKHYCNEQEGLITSLNLYGYSLVNNIEYGVHFSKTILNPLDKLFEETEAYTDELMFNLSEVVYLKKPQYSKKLFGLKKVYQQSKVLFDISEAVFSGNHYESKRLEEFDLDIESSLEKKYTDKPQREALAEKVIVNTMFNTNKVDFQDEKDPERGFCIRTGNDIRYNPERPYCYSAYKTWAKFENHDFPENYCHKTGEESDGKTSMSHPILNEVYSNSNV